MIHCINCGHVNAEGASQCEACYEPLPAVTSCPTCQASVPEDAFFCPQCGASLPRGVANQGTPDSDSPVGVPAPSFSELPPTNVVAQQSFGGGAPLPPTNVVHSPPPGELPPTNVVNPAIRESAAAPDSAVPPTYVANQPSMPDTIPPRPPSPADATPPTNVVHPPTADFASQEQSVERSVPDPPQGDANEQGDEIETLPTMVVSPSSDRDVVDAPKPPPVQPPPVDVVPAPSPDLASPPPMPPTMPPQQPPRFETQSFEADTDDGTATPPVFESIAPDTIPEPPTEAMSDEDVEDLPDVGEPQEIASVPGATTVQPSMPPVGETVIQMPPARLLHERSDTPITLPTNQDVILIGKTTSTVNPDVDVSGFADSDVVSRRHAAIFVDPSGYAVEDLGSSNGTYVNDEPCSQGDRTPINPGDRICLGRENKVCFIFQIG